MPEFLTQYYGTDLINAVGVIVGIYLIGKKNRLGFIANVIGSAAGIVYAVMTESTPILILNIMLIILNTRGYLKWKHS